MAKSSRAVVVSTPTSIKSFVIKFLELTHMLEQNRLGALNSDGSSFNFDPFGGIAKLFGNKSAVTDAAIVTPEQIESFRQQVLPSPPLRSLSSESVDVLNPAPR